MMYSYLSFHNPDVSAIMVGHVTFYKLKKECCLLKSCLHAERMLLVMVSRYSCCQERFGQCIM